MLSKLLQSVCNTITSRWSFFITHIFVLKKYQKKIKLLHIHKKKIKMVSPKKSVVVKNGFLYRQHRLNCKFTPFTSTYLQDRMPTTSSRTNEQNEAQCAFCAYLLEWIYIVNGSLTVYGNKQLSLFPCLFNNAIFYMYL